MFRTEVYTIFFQVCLMFRVTWFGEEGGEGGTEPLLRGHNGNEHWSGLDPEYSKFSYLDCVRIATYFKRVGSGPDLYCRVYGNVVFCCQKNGKLLAFLKYFWSWN